MISDFYPLNERNAAYSIYFLGIPLGAAIGFGLGPTIAKKYGWRMAFVILGIPGMIISFFILRMNNPIRGINDKSEKRRLSSSNTNLVASEEKDQEEANNMNNHTTSMTVETKPPKSSICDDLKVLVCNPHYMTATLGLIFINFCMGGLGDWYT